MLPAVPPLALASVFGDEVPPLALDLASKLLRYSPTDRLTAAAALQHPLFQTTPVPSMQ